jgi:tRNA A-37 threonylcarbamoyl transferase component Bud32
MAVLVTNPEAEALLGELGLTTPEAFLRWPGVIYTGHPDRHVRHVTLNTADGSLSAFLKCELRVRWRDRFVNSWQGFGPVSKALREWHTLRQVRERGFGCPEALAAGEWAGQAFLLVCQVEGVEDLRAYLAAHPALQERTELACALGRELARLHGAGISHGDLYSKHVLVKPPTATKETAFVLLDWQRSCRAESLAWSARRRDLATLLATLVDDLFPAACRRAFVGAYAAAVCQKNGDLPGPDTMREELHEQAQRLKRKRKFREVSQVPLPAGEQNLIWLDGEALCVTRQFYSRVGGRLPAELEQTAVASEACTSTPIIYGDGELATLHRRLQGCWLRRCWSALRRKKLTSPELRQAATIFRLERFRVRGPRLLAVGQHYAGFGRMSSFLLTAPPGAAVRLTEWFDQAADGRARRRVIEQGAAVVRAIHAADCVLGKEAALVLQREAEVGVDTVAGMRPARRIRFADCCRDLRRLREEFARLCRRTEQLRFVLHYLDRRRLCPEVRRLVSQLFTGPRGGLIFSSQRSRGRC